MSRPAHRIRLYAEALLVALDRLKASGNSLFVVEHELDVICHADWIVDARACGGRARRTNPLYSGPPSGLKSIPRIKNAAVLIRRGNATSIAHRHALGADGFAGRGHAQQSQKPGRGRFPLGTLTAVTGVVLVPGKSSLVSQALVWNWSASTSGILLRRMMKIQTLSTEMLRYLPKAALLMA